VGYWLKEEEWGKGVMTETLKFYLREIFNHFPSMYRIHAHVYEFNTRSAKVLEKANFKFEGILRDFELKNGMFYSVRIYSLLRSDLL